MSFLSKTAATTLRKFGPLFIPTSGHTAGDHGRCRSKADFDKVFFP